MRTTVVTLMVASLFLPVSVALGGQIVQTGTLNGAGAPMTQPLMLNAFDDQGGTLQLTSVTIDALTSIGGGYTTDGSGVSVDVDASLVADYSLAGTLLVETEAVIDLTVPNNGPPIAVSVFDNDTDMTTITDPADLAAWTGSAGATVTLDVFTSFTIVETPPGVIFFGAGGSVQYTVTYEFEPAPPSTAFRRGDVNADGSFDIGDPIALLGTLFSGDPPSSCADASDVNDDGSTNIADAISALSALFGGGADPAPPFATCGDDPTDDGLDCADFAPCP